MRPTICISIILIILSFGANGQRRIELDNAYRTRGYKTFNVDGAEIYYLANTDTVFVPKIGAYDFLPSERMDSLVNTAQSESMIFFVKTHFRSYLVEVSKSMYLMSKGIKFHFGKGKHGSYGAVTYWIGCGPASNAAAVILPNKEWKRKFYPYTGF